MKHQQGTFRGVAGVELFYQSWHPPISPCGILIIVHGLGGHSGLFDTIINYLLPLNYAIYACDLRGHGRSPGQRAYINKWAEFRGDIDAFITLIKQQESDCPCFIYGHSLGGIIVLDYSLRYPEKIQGVIAVGAPLGRVGVSPFKLTIGKILSRLWPRFTLDTGISLEEGTRDETILIDYINDPLRHTQGTARLATEMLATVEWIQSHASDLKVPLLLLHGGKDRISLPEGSHTFFKNVTFSDKKFLEYPDAFHELHNEVNHQEIISDLSNWLKQHQKQFNS